MFRLGSRCFSRVFFLDNDLRRPIQSKLVCLRWGLLLSLGEWLFMKPAIRKPLLLPSGGEVLKEVVTCLGTVVVVGIDVVLDMGVKIIEVKFVDAEDVVVVEFVLDVNVAVVADVDVDGVKALVMGGVVPLVLQMLVC